MRLYFHIMFVYAKLKVMLVMLPECSDALFLDFLLHFLCVCVCCVFLSFFIMDFLHFIYRCISIN